MKQGKYGEGHGEEQINERTYTLRIKHSKERYWKRQTSDAQEETTHFWNLTKAMDKQRAHNALIKGGNKLIYSNQEKADFVTKEKTQKSRTSVPSG